MIASDIKKIQEALDRKADALTELHRNLLTSTQKKIAEFPTLCDHTDEYGKPSTGKEHKIVVPSLTGDTTLIKQMCSLCGVTMSEKTYNTKKPENVAVNWYSDDLVNDDLNSFDTMVFNPNFTSDFTGYIVLNPTNNE